MFRQLNNVTLHLLHAATSSRLAAHEVVIDGHATGFTVPAQVIEAAIEVDESRLLLFLTDDVPFEEALEIVLIDRQQGVKEMLTLGGAYTTGSFADLALFSQAVEFSFIGDTTWRVEIPDRPFFRLPFVGDPRGIWRPVARKHYILVSADPPPARMDGSR
ncbi:hypothetical protein QM201_18585 [Enterobacter asburiae]|nr:hypothetical protein [Enterobacter asburiae]